MTEVYISVGSNVEAERHVRFALAAIAERFGRIELSPCYANPAVGFAGDEYLNVVVRAESMLPPSIVIDMLREIEWAGGRAVSAVRWGPRTLDIDLLLYGSAVEPALRIPRTDVLRAAYVLCPLMDLAPTLRHPVTGQRLRDVWAAHPSAVALWTRHGRVMSTSAPAQPQCVVQTQPVAAAE